MLGTTTAAAAAAAANTDSPNSLAQNGCSTCLVNFESKETRRAHMREDSHVYNLKRRIASLPPISFTVFDSQVRASGSGDDESEEHYPNDKARYDHLKSRNRIKEGAELNRQSSSLSDEEPTSSSSHPKDSDEPFRPQRCLFCSFDSPSLDTNLTHMSHAHSFFIPDTEHLIDVSSFLSYLHAVISVFHECLFCGCERGSKAGVQDHMRGKGHCKLNFEGAEDELWEFWEFEDAESGDGNVKEERDTMGDVRLGVDEDELRLPSGKILGHRSTYGRNPRQHHSRSKPSSSPEEQLLLTENGSEEDLTLPQSKDQRLVRRKGTEMSMIGVPELQQRALMVAEKKMEAVQARARNEYQAGVERGANRQKTFRVTGIGKKRGGLEKRNG